VLTQNRKPALLRVAARLYLSLGWRCWRAAWGKMIPQQGSGDYHHLARVIPFTRSENTPPITPISDYVNPTHPKGAIDLQSSTLGYVLIHDPYYAACQADAALPVPAAR